MAQQTALAVYGTPGMVHTFAPKGGGITPEPDVCGALLLCLEDSISVVDMEDRILIVEMEPAMALCLDDHELVIDYCDREIMMVCP